MTILDEKLTSWLREIGLTKYNGEYSVVFGL